MYLMYQTPGQTIRQVTADESTAARANGRNLH
jgi:hypothetical protein